jgi:hypothetical protein
MLEKVAAILFACGHRNYSFPVTIKTLRQRSSAPAGMYVVCLDCGRELPYDWSRMKLASPAFDRRSGSSPLLPDQPSLP